MIGSHVITPDGAGVVVGYAETGVEVMLDDEYVADSNGIYHQMKNVYEPEDIALIE